MEFKYKTSFSSFVKSLVPEEKDMYLSLASLADIGDFIPDIDTNKDFDLLPIAFNSFVANRVNKNGDVVDTETALSIAEHFVNKPINIEHDRKKVIGAILVAGFSEFGSDKPLDREKIKDTTGPFNVTLGGVLWRVVNDDITDLVEEASDPTSNVYQQISASWELGFNEYNLAIMEAGEKNLENATIVADKDKVNELKDHLRANGGDGTTEDGKSIYRQVVANVVPLGIGLTENPAADVKGIATMSETILPVLEEEKAENQEEPEEVVFEENSSQEQKNNVIENKDSTIMEIKSLKDINDESLKEVSASQVTDFIEDELEKACEKFAEEKSAVENALKAAEEEQAKLNDDHQTLQNELEKVQETVKALEEEKAERQRLEQFNTRMAALDEQYQLSDEERKVLAADIKELDEESFSAYSDKLAILLKDKNKEAQAEEAKIEVEKTNETIVENEATTEEVVEEAVSEAQEEPTEAVANTTNPEEPTIYEKYKEAFSSEGFQIKL